MGSPSGYIRYSAYIGSVLTVDFYADSYRTVRDRICEQRTACYMKMGVHPRRLGQRKGRRIQSYIFKEVSLHQHLRR